MGPGRRIGARYSNHSPFGLGSTSPSTSWANRSRCSRQAPRPGATNSFTKSVPRAAGHHRTPHPWDESFYVIAGEIMFSINDHEASAVPGTLVHLPAGTKHWFRLGEGGGEMLSITSREAVSHLFIDLDREISPDEPDFDKLVEISVRHGLEILVPS